MRFAVDTPSVEAYALAKLTTKAQTYLDRARTDVLFPLPLGKLQVPRATPGGAGDELVATCAGSAPGTVSERERERGREVKPLCALHTSTHALTHTH
jgi:hypothetical protein